MEVTKPRPLSAPVLRKTTQKSNFLTASLPMDCVVRTSSSDTIKEYVLAKIRVISYSNQPVVVYTFVTGSSAATTGLTLPQHFKFIFLFFLVMQHLYTTAGGANSAVVGDGEGNPAAHERHDAARPRASPLLSS